MDGGACQAIDRGVTKTKSRTRLSDFHFTSRSTVNGTAGGHITPKEECLRALCCWTCLEGPSERVWDS